MQQQGKTRSSLVGWLVGVVVVLVIFGIFARSLYRQQFDNFFRGLEPTCSVSAFGATITVQGWSANDDCQHMLYGGDNFTGVKWTGATPISSADGSIICEQDIDGRHVTVRGNGVVCGMLNPLPPPLGQ